MSLSTNDVLVTTDHVFGKQDSEDGIFGVMQRWPLPLFSLPPTLNSVESKLLAPLSLSLSLRLSPCQTRAVESAEYELVAW